jgi:hypothetical protein
MVGIGGEIGSTVPGHCGQKMIGSGTGKDE